MLTPQRDVATIERPEFLALPPEQQAVLIAIVGGKEAWTAAKALRVPHEVLEALERGGWITRWVFDKADRALDGGPLLALTAWGAWMLGVTIAEHVDFLPDTQERQAKRSARWIDSGGSYHFRIEKVRVKVPVEVPAWSSFGTDPLGDPILDPRQKKQPREAGIAPLIWPEELVDHRTIEPDDLLDEDGTPIVILGQPVKLDPRLVKNPVGKVQEKKRAEGEDEADHRGVTGGPLARLIRGVSSSTAAGI